MAANDPHTGMGSMLQRGDDASPPNYVTVAGVKSISGPGFTRETHATTTMASPQFREIVGGLSDGGEVSFTGNFLPADDSQNQSTGGLMAEFGIDSCNSVRPWRIIGPICPGDETPIFSFNGVMTAFQPEIPMDDLMSFSATIKVSGQPTLDMESV